MTGRTMCSDSLRIDRSQLNITYMNDRTRVPSSSSGGEVEEFVHTAAEFGLLGVDAPVQLAHPHVVKIGRISFLTKYPPI
jgi:hypothetical protein